MGEVRGVEKGQEEVACAEVKGEVCLSHHQNGEEAVDAQRGYMPSVAKQM